MRLVVFYAIAIKMKIAFSDINLNRIFYFCFQQTRELAEIVGKFLGLKGVRVAICHAGMSYENRKKALDELRSGSVDVAVTTNVLVRAIDIPTVRAVMNFELPQNNNENAPLSADIKRYWYRIGRATRFGKHKENTATSVLQFYF